MSTQKNHHFFRTVFGSVMIAERFRGPHRFTTINLYTWNQFISNIMTGLEILALHPRGSLNRRGVRFLQKIIENFIFSRYLFRTPSNHSKNLKNGISGENARS